MVDRLNLPLRLAIIMSGKRQRRIARLARMHESALSLIINGHRIPTDAERARLAKTLGKPESELFGEAI